MRLVADVFEEHLGKLKFDQHLAKAMYKFQTYFVSKNEDHMTFFGGHLTGVEIVRFMPRDFDMFYDMVKVDPVQLQQDLYECDAINPNFKVSSNAFNLLCMWLIHGFLRSNLLDNTKKARAALDVALIFNYRCITALLADYFTYPADPKLAEATYARLSYRFLLKKLGTWQAVMDYRAQDLVSKEGLHYRTLFDFKDDLAIVNALNDAQGRIRDMLKNIYGEFIEAHSSGERIKVTSSTGVDMDGDDVLKDKVHGVENYITYITTVATDKNSFVKEELVAIILKVLPTINRNKFTVLLNAVCDMMRELEHDQLTELIRLTMVHSHSFLQEHEYLVHNKKDLGGMLMGLKGVYTSSRSSDPELMEMREIGEKIVRGCLDHTSDQLVAALRTGLFLYINLRAYTKHYYA